MKQLLLLLVIVIIAGFFRIYQIGLVPPSPSLDEVSTGYNAYSILKTGADEYGYRFPLLLRAYDDWRPALYVYLVIPFINLFGLTPEAVRFPSVVLSILTVIASYFLSKNLFKSFKDYIDPKDLGLLTSFLLAISPWHIYISRLGHEANAGLAFFVFGLLFFIKRSLSLSMAFFALSFASYQSEKIIIPLFVLLLVVLYKDWILPIKNRFLLISAISLLLLAPFLRESLSGNALIRLKGTNVFEPHIKRFEQQVILLSQSKGNMLDKIIYNRRVVGAQILAESYLSHFNPVWLFTNPSGQSHKIPNIGLLYLWELPFIIIGLYLLIKSQLDRRVKLIIVWLLISPLPASVTSDSPHAMRTYTFLPVWQILTSLGIFFIAHRFIRYRYATYVFFFGLFLVSSIYLYQQYFFVFPKTQSASFQYALSNAIKYVIKNEDSYSQIIFASDDSLRFSYMFFLFHKMYDPYLYQKQGGTQSGGFAATHSFGKYEFRPIDVAKEKKNALLIGNISDFSSSSNFEDIATFTNLDGKAATKIVKIIL